MVASKRFSYEPQELLPDLYCIPLPLHDGSPVNAFVATRDDGVWLIDGGLGTEECQAVLAAGLKSLGYADALADVRGLLITHGHTDHVGAAETVLAGGGEIVAHRLETTEGRRLAFEPSWLRRNGLPADSLGQDRWRGFSWPQPTRLLEDGERLHWGNLDLEVIWCPGHTRGLVCLFEPQRSLLFSTDHVMRRAPTPITVRSDTDADPLSDYLGSLQKLARLPAETVLPGHGRPFGGLANRLAHIQSEIQEQLDQIQRGLANGPSSAYELLRISPRAFGDRRPMAEPYALSVLLARLRHLECLGAIQRVDDAEGITYALNAD
ncbi:MAG: MBL fold metallo-hydrolase [Chloroflexota bacterium]|nr:MBL fold metallo-hydrolase [Chloroflexota bacterium]